MTETLPAIRVKHPCQNGHEFLERYAARIASKGVQIPTAKLRPIGSHVRLILELRSGEVVSGDAVVHSHVRIRENPGVLLRYVRLHEGGIAFPLGSPPSPTPSPPAAQEATTRGSPGPRLASPSPFAPSPASGSTPRSWAHAASESAASSSGGGDVLEMLRPLPEPDPPARTPPLGTAPPGPPFLARAARTRPPLTLDDLDPTIGLDVERAGAAAAVPALHPEPAAALPALHPEPAAALPALHPEPAAALPALFPESPEQLPALYTDADRPPRATPSPMMQPELERADSAGPGPKGSSSAPGWRRDVLVALALALIAVVGAGVAGYLVRSRRTARPSAIDPADAKIVAALARADQRIARGALVGGPDAALAHLQAARSLRPDDGRVRRRLQLLADTLEALGTRALERGDMEEAEVHLSAADQADPGRANVRAGLDRLKARSVP